MGKTLLILGNGFDLAHGLPTRYTDFIYFCEAIKSLLIKKKNITGCINTKTCSDITEESTNKIHPSIADYITNELGCRKNCSHKKTYNINKDKFYSLIKFLKDNIWYGYLFYLLETNKIKGVNWIDFESEICIIVRALDRASNDLYKRYIEIKNAFFSNSSSDIEKLQIFDNNFSSMICEMTLFELRKKLYNDLINLTHCLEIYLLIIEEILEPIPIYIFSNQIKPDYVISFNYTHTYEKLYKKVKSVFHIHGSCRDCGSNNMILGIDEYWSDSEKDSHTNFTMFKKFAQRIQKNIGQEHIKIHNALSENIVFDYPYKYIFETIQSLKKPSNIYIFGHSLDVTDKDILNMFLNNDKFVVTIFCRDEETKNEYISNVIKIIGENKLIEKVNEYPPKMKFVIQDAFIT